MEINEDTLDRLDAVLTSPKREEYFKQLYGEIDKILVCPECGNSLNLDIPDDWSRMDMWGCDDCRKAWSVDELDAIYQEKQ